MSLGWSTRLRVILALFIVLTASPLVSAMDTGTPEPDPGTISEEVTPTEAPPVEDTPPLEPAPTDPPVEPTEVPATEVPPTLAPTEEPTSIPTEAPEPTATAEPTEDATASSPDAAASSITEPAAGIQAAGPSALLLVVQQCEDNDRVGQFEFLPVRQSTGIMANNTAYNCLPAASATVTVTPLDGGAPSVAELVQGQFLMTNLPAGTYTVAVTIGSDTGVSAELEFPAYDGYALPVMYFVEETPQPEPEEGVGIVDVLELNCHDPERVGEADFLVGVQPSAPRMQAASGTTECMPANPDPTSFTLTSVDDPSQTLTPVLNESGMIRFTDVPSGSYTLTANPTGAVSKPFIVTDGMTTAVNVITFVGQLPDVPASIRIEHVYCEDDVRAGETDYALVDGVRVLAETSTCYAQPPGEMPGTITITFHHEDTGEDYPVVLDAGGYGYLEDLPPGTYTVTRSASGLPDATSVPIQITGPTPQRLHVVTYVEATGLPDPGGDGYGYLRGSVWYCESTEREDGDVDFIIDRGVRSLQATSECVEEPTVTGQVVVYEYDEATGQPGEDTGITFNPIEGSFSLAFEPGYYVLGYRNPVTEEVVFSDSFIIQDGWFTDFLIHVYSDPVRTGNLIVEKLICVDPGRAGDTVFTTVGMGAPDTLQAQANTSVNCRWPFSPELYTEYTLENVDSGQIWEVQLLPSTPIQFSGVPDGTYTLTETDPDDGSSATSAPFVYEASLSGSWLTVTTFIAEADWEPHEAGGEVDVRITAFICVDPDREGDSEFSIIGNPGAPSGDAGDSTNGDTMRCRLAVMMDAQGLVFEATPTNGGDPISFVLSGGPEFLSFVPMGPFPAGEYVITETTSGATTGPLDLTAYSSTIRFYRFYQQPVSGVDVNVRSANPTVADTLPEGATWSITAQGSETPVASGTLPEGALTPPQVVDVQEPLPYGDYTVTVTAGPSFNPYSETFTVDAPTETFAVQLEPVTESTVTISVESADPDIASVTPEGATWIVTLEDGTPVDSDTFAPEHLQLPAEITVEAPVPFGSYVVTVDAGPTFHPFGPETFIVDELTESFQVELVPVTEATVEIDVVSDAPAVADVLPDDASWTVTLEDGTPVDSGVFLPEHRQLPVTIPVTGPVPFGTYLVSVNAGPTFEPYGPTPVTVDTVDEAVEVRLVPVTEAEVTINVVSADPAIASALPADASWTVTLQDGTPVDSDTFAPEHLALPQEIAVEAPVPFGTYVVTVDAGPTFEPYGPEAFTVDELIEEFEVELIPVTEAEVIIDVSSAMPDIANVLPEDATWTVTLEDGTPLDNDTFALEHLQLPAEIAVSNPLPFGTYVVTIDAGPVFDPFGPVTFAVDEPSEVFEVTLTPVTESEVTINLSSVAPEVADTLPDDATWSVSLEDGTPVDSDTFAPEHLTLPQSIDVNDPVPFGTYTITVEAGPTFEPYSRSVTIDALVQEVDIALIPVEVPTELVDLQLSSGDPDVADRVPEGSTWSITSVDNPDLVLEGTFAADQLGLPVTIPVGTPLPHGTYFVTVDASPAFLPYEDIFTVGDDDDTSASSVTRQGFFALQQAPTTVEIVLQPAPVEPTPTPEPTVTPEPTPDPTATPEPTATPDPADPTVPATPDDPAEEPTGTPGAGTTISSLPNTGQGASGPSVAGLLFLTATVALVASISGLMVRRNWT